MDTQKIVQFINRNRLFSPEEKILVALSGGADSVALLHLLLSAGYTCEAAHCNFHLRDAESDRDEAFVRNLCNARHVPLHTVHFDTKREAEGRHISIEMAARELRYAWFEEIRKNAAPASSPSHTTRTTVWKPFCSTSSGEPASTACGEYVPRTEK